MSEIAKKKVQDVMKDNGITLSCQKFGSIEKIAKLANYSSGYTRTLLGLLYKEGMTWVADQTCVPSEPHDPGHYHSLNDIGAPHMWIAKEELQNELPGPLFGPCSVDREGNRVSRWEGRYDWLDEAIKKYAVRH